MIQTVERAPVQLVDVTQRDGEQMEIDKVSIEDRIAVFDKLVSTGIQTFEVGHLGNSGKEDWDEGDQAYARALVQHIQKMDRTDVRYRDIRLQVLFGSQQEIMSEGLESLSGFDKDRVIIHVYDRLSGHLRDLARSRYSIEGSARRVASAAQIALDCGFKHFSVSGEGATDVSVEDAVDFYAYVGEYLEANGAQSINFNLADTFGSPVIWDEEGEWNEQGLLWFDTQVKQRVPGATTSVHVHNDDGISAVDFSVAAVRAGFDKVEGTLFGMGERCGNTALCDMMVQFMQQARSNIELTQRPRSIHKLGRVATRPRFFDERHVETSVMDNLESWYGACEEISLIYGGLAPARFRTTSLGHPEAYKAGSGPHDQACLRAIEDPVKYPLYENYLRIALPHAMLGRPEAEGIIAADPVVIKGITINGRASGGSTAKIVNGQFEASDNRKAAVRIAQKKMGAIAARMAA